VTFFTLSAAFLLIFVPVGPEPVKEIRSISGWLLMPLPTTSPVPFTKLKTPFGTPASCATYAKRIAENGVNSDGFKITGHPAAKALAILIAVWFVGKFQGVINPHTPIASFTIIEGPRFSSN